MSNELLNHLKGNHKTATTVEHDPRYLRTGYFGNKVLLVMILRFVLKNIGSYIT